MEPKVIDPNDHAGPLVEVLRQPVPRDQAERVSAEPARKENRYVALTTHRQALETDANGGEF